MKIFTTILIVLFVLTIKTNAQIPNSGFENWTTVGNYEDPIDWATMNAVCAGPFYSCTKSTDHYPPSIGNYSIRIETNTSLTQVTGGWGVVVTDTMAYPIQPSFPVIGHPNSLCGYYKYIPQNNDLLWITIWLFNDGVIISQAEIQGNASASWTSFTMPFDTYSAADSATIMLCAYSPTGPTDGPNGNSVLYVDNLSFDDLVSISEESTERNIFHLYPNPASDIINLDIYNPSNADLTLKIYNVIGTLVKSKILNPNKLQFVVGDLSNGIYMLEIESKEWTENQKLIIQR
jgi:hypothetical protein